MAKIKNEIPIVHSDIKLIRKANEFVEARYKFDIWETRVFAFMLTLIKNSDKDFEEYTIYTGDIVREFGLNDGGKVYEEIKKASEKLLTKRVQIERISANGTPEILDTYLVVSSARPKNPTKDSYIKLRFHSDLKPFLIELKERYLVYDIRNILSLSSVYSIRIYELLKQYFKIGKRRFLIDELKTLLSIEPSEYALYGHFKERVIKKSQKDLYEHTDIYFEFEEELSKKKVIAIVFHIYENKKNKIVRKQEIRDAEEPITTTNKRKIDEQAINHVYAKVHQYVSKRQVKKWFDDYPQEQIEKGIQFTINHLNAGNLINNIGGYLNTMVQTPSLYDKYDYKKKQIDILNHEQKQSVELIEKKISELEELQTRFTSQSISLETQLLKMSPELETLLAQKIKNNIFYNHSISYLENLERESIKGVRGAILFDLFPELEQFSNAYIKEKAAIEDELKKLGWKR